MHDALNCHYNSVQAYRCTCHVYISGTILYVTDRYKVRKGAHIGNNVPLDTCHLRPSLHRGAAGTKTAFRRKDFSLHYIFAFITCSVRASTT